MTEARRKFLKKATVGLIGAGVLITGVPFLYSLRRNDGSPPAPFIDIKINKLEVGQRVQLEARGKPIWVIRRGENELAELEKENPNLRDPYSIESIQPELAKNIYRSLQKEIFVGIGVCTHLGCSPDFKSSLEAKDRQVPLGGSICACHGAIYDSAGRVEKGSPAPYNLGVPDYEFVNKNTIRIYIDKPIEIRP